ncbi:MAG: phenylalanine--tRNA ligase subunit beta [Thermoleophilia bacterium]|jgi:phenylalanyl-tRNA synthetase beta chain
MKVPISWLKEYVAIDMTASELADRLALTGTEVERVTRVGLPAEDGNLDRFVVGRVKKKSAHPDADKLTLCEVEVGDGKVEQIVCGAKNFKEGDKAAVCLPGGTLPDGRKLEAAVIRGVESRGMMCSESELGLSSESAGIMILPEDAPVGTRLVDYIPVSDEVLELEITPNRPDCLSVYGIAREVAAITGAALAPEPVEDVEARGDDNIEELINITVDDSDLCPRYGARLIAGVQVAPSPPWLKARIVAAGMRPVNNVVDITNYVMWTLGEPMHAFDLARIGGREAMARQTKTGVPLPAKLHPDEDGRMLIVRRASKAEKITTIDGSERKLNKNMLVVADGRKPTAIAGIMGGASSEVSDETTDILLEAANFNGPNVMKTEMALGLRSESSTRFEKGLDAEVVPKALAMASRMLVELCGGRLVPGEYDIYEKPRTEQAIHLREEKVTSLLGITVPGAEIEAILARLGFEIRREGAALHVTVPSFRADVEREVDLIEEIVRIFGYDLIPPTLPSDMRVLGGLSGYQTAERKIALALTAAGVNEAITYTFIAPDFADRLRLTDDDPRRQVIKLANPLSVEQSVMRSLMLPSLLMTVALNLSMRNPDVNIFELGRTYHDVKNEKLAEENRTVAGCLCGSLKGESWMHAGRETDYFTGKGIAEAIFKAVKGSFSVEPCDEPFLHPGKSAFILVDGKRAGFIGEVHPLVLEAFDIDKPVVAFEILEDALIASSAGIVIFEDLLTFPASFQDIAVVVDEKTAAEEVLSVVREAGAPLLRDARVFDTYTGDQVGEGKKSIALGLEFRSPERTLTDEDVDGARGAILAALGERLKATLRG